MTQTPPDFTRAYREIKQTLDGPKSGPADTITLAKLQSLQDRIEPGSMPVNMEVAAASIAVSLRRIADSLEKAHNPPRVLPEQPEFFKPDKFSHERAFDGEWR